jgi:uncharacterized membrane protein YvbJ
MEAIGNLVDKVKENILVASFVTVLLIIIVFLIFRKPKTESATGSKKTAKSSADDDEPEDEVDALIASIEDKQSKAPGEDK